MEIAKGCPIWAALALMSPEHELFHEHEFGGGKGPIDKGLGKPSEVDTRWKSAGVKANFALVTDGSVPDVRSSASQSIIEVDGVHAGIWSVNLKATVRIERIGIGAEFKLAGNEGRTR